MDVTIKGFRSCQDGSYKITNFLTLISGLSGAGKSTIFQAIYWALYGHLRNVYDASGVTTKCQVTISLERMTIYRQGKPNLLKVSMVEDGKDGKEKKVEYEDQVAQKIILQKFGSRDVWRSTSYIEQGSRSHFMTINNTERMEILSALSFSSENPEQYIDRIDQEIRTLQSKITLLEARYSSDVELFNKDIQKRPVHGEVLQLVGQTDEILQNHIKVKKDLDIKREAQKRDIQLRGQYHSLDSSIKEKKKRVESIDYTPTDKITTLKEAITNLQSQLTNLKETKDKIDQWVTTSNSVASSLKNLQEQWPNWKDVMDTRQKSSTNPSTNSSTNPPR